MTKQKREYGVSVVWAGGKRSYCTTFFTTQIEAVKYAKYMRRKLSRERAQSTSEKKGPGARVIVFHSIVELPCTEEYADADTDAGI